MKNYQTGNYALNKNSEGIVYRFADGTTATYTLADYLAENPGKTEADFAALKELSDSDYRTTDRADNAQTKNNTAFDEMSAAMLRFSPSPEDLLVREINEREAAERHERQVELSKRVLGKICWY